MTFALRTLEFDKIRARLSELTSFSAGRERALALEPTSDPDESNRWQAGTAEALKLADVKPELGLGGAHDVRPQVARAELGGLLLPADLLEIGDLIRCARRWRATLLRLDDRFPTLAVAGRRLSEHRPVLEEIQTAIGESAEVLDSASSDLRRIRSSLRTAQERVRARLQEIISSSTIRQALQEPIITERNGRFVVPVRAEARSRLRGIVHDQSASGATLFVEPLEVVELANRARQLAVEEEQEIERILRALSKLVAVQAPELAESVEALAELDLQVAKARLAADMRAARPRLQSFEQRDAAEPVLHLLDARHPLLGPGAVPLTLELGREFDILVITGPNTGGKTVALKTLGLLSLMAQSGLQIPASEGSTLTVFRSIYADIGDEQSIEQSLSTFSSHVSHIVEMLRGADDRTLVLLDELGAGTDPREGSALARALLEHLRQRRVYCLATTHFSDLKLYAHGAPRVENASVEFDPATLSPTYRLLVGLPGRSNALEIAARLGVPAPILARARSHLDPAEIEAGQLLDRIQRERQLAEEARSQADRDRTTAARARREAEATLAELRLERQTVWREAEEASRRQLAELQREITALEAELRRSRVDRSPVEALAQRAAALRPVVEPAQARAEPALPADESVHEVAGPLAVGSDIVVPSLGLAGRITRLEPDEAEVDVHGMRVRLRSADLAAARRATEHERTSSSPPATTRVVLRTRDAQVPIQLDLRGHRREEAAEELDRYLNEAYLAGLKQVRIVHGKGSGAVRKAVHELLEVHPLVRRFEVAARDAGGDGATEVDLVA